ncbi:MAG: FtsX-like permease family protein [Ruminococcus sp.]|nr:FtsX-like permease family protein [uncultured Schaedlerella sp.]MCI9153007.1 FtsX-like permease family protein [Ruminococcus sp.]
MKKSILIARSNLRQAKGQAAAITVLILLAAFMLNLWLMLSLDYKRNFDRCHDRLNAEHVTLALSSDDARLRDFVVETLEKDSRTEDYRIDDCISTFGSFAYNNGEVNTDLVILEKEAALRRSIGKAELVEDSASSSGIYLPVLYSTGTYSPGGAIDITIGNDSENYSICGSFNSAMAGSHNCSMSALLLTKELYEKLEDKKIAPRSTLVSIRLHDKSESENFEAYLENTVSSRFPDVHAISNSYAQVSTSRYISQMICSGIVCAMAFLVTLIALVVIVSNVINYIQENMKSLGAWMAVGYTSGQLVFTLILQFLGITLVTSLAGIWLSYCVFPSVNEMMTSQTGIPYEIRFLPLPAILTLAAANGTVALSVWTASRRIKKIEPIAALRQGVQTHSFKRNPVPLEHTKAPLHLALALKATLSGMKQNVTVCITMLVLSLVVVFSGLMVENMIVDIDPFINLIVGETADSCISINPEIKGRFLQTMGSDQQIQSTYLFHTTEVCHVGGIALMATISDDFADVNNQNVCFDGRFPKYNNEMAVAAKYAREHGLKIGDEITLTAEGNEARYLISGFTQISNNLGKDCLLTRSGYERMGRLQNENYYINTVDEVDIDAFNTEVSEEFGPDIYATVNIRSVMNGSTAVYVSLMTAIVIAVLILSACIVTFVLYLLVRTMLNSKKRDYGILKALGFTTGQLVLQTALSFMPAVIVSAVLGITVSALVINPLTALFLRGIGIVKCTFSIPVGFSIAAGAGLIVFAFAAACLLSMKIRKIAPRTLLTGE